LAAIKSQPPQSLSRSGLYDWPQPDITRSSTVVIASSRTFMGRIIHGGVCVNAIDKPLEWAVGFFFGNTALSLELWTVIAGISGFDD